MSGSLALVVTPHPITTQGRQVLDAQAAQFRPGEKLVDLLARHGVLPGQQWVVTIGGVPVPEQHWARVTPYHGHLIEAARVPEKSVLRLVAILALNYFTFGAGSIFGTTLLGKIMAGVAFLAGSVVINKLLGPKPIKQQSSNAADSPTYSLQGGRNRSRPFEPMALVLGMPYAVPDLAGQPYTFFADGEQHLWQVFHTGINCAQVSDIRIGQTPLENFQGVHLLRDGMISDNHGLPALGNSVDSVAGALLESPTGAGPFVTRTSSPNTILLAVDIEAQLYRTDDKGAYASHNLTVQIEFRAVGDVAWTGFLDGDVNLLVLSNGNTRPLRRTLQRAVPLGQYEVRLHKSNEDSHVTTETNTVQWTTLKSYQVDPASYVGQSRFALKIQASGQLTGSLEEVNCQLRALPMPYWDGAGWVTATDRATGLCNPGALILLLARGIYDEDDRLLAGLGLDDAQIDIESLKGFMVHCAAHDFEFDYFLQETTSIGELLDAIAAAGMGTTGWPDGKLGVIWFADDEPISGVLNMANIKVRSFSVEYNTDVTAEEIEFQYFDRERGNAWKSVRVLAPGVTTPTQTGRQQLVGVGNERQAAVLARFSMAQNIYQRKTVTGEVDLEHMTFRRGSVMALSHDLTQWGYSGRVQAAVNNAGILTLTLDELVPNTSPSGATSRYIGLRLAGESQYRIFPVSAFVGPSRTITLATAWPGGISVPGDAPGNPAHDCLWIYDFKATPGQKLRVADIAPQGDLDGAKVALVAESDEFWDYVWNGTYSPPPNSSLLGQGPPAITTVRITEQLEPQGNTYFTELTATFDLTGAYSRAELWGAIGDGELQRIATTMSQSVRWRGGLDEVWRLELRPFSTYRAGAAYALTYTVVGLRMPPPDIDGLSWDGKAFRWTQETGTPDLAGIVARFNYGSNDDGGVAEPLVKGVVTENPWTPRSLPSGACTVMFWNIDSTGNESLLPAVIYLNLGDPEIANIVESRDFQAAGWPGTLTGGTIVSGEIKADNTSPFYGPPASRHYSTNPNAPYYTNNYSEMVWESDKWLVGTWAQGAEMKIISTITGPYYTIEYRRPGQSRFYDADPTAPHYSSDPSAPYYVTDEPYETFPGSVISQPGFYQYRLRIGSGPVQGVGSAFTAVIDVQDKVLENVPVALVAGGTRITSVIGEFSSIKSVRGSLTGVGTATGVRIVDHDHLLGPLVQPTIGSVDGGAGNFSADIKGVPA